MSAEEAANGKKSYWAELEISGKSTLQKLQVELRCTRTEVKAIRGLS